MLIKQLKNKSTRLLWWNLFVCVGKKFIFLCMKALGSWVLYCSSNIKDQTILWNSSEVKGLKTVNRLLCNKVQSKPWIKEDLDTLTIRQSHWDNTSQHLLDSNQFTSPMGFLQGKNDLWYVSRVSEEILMPQTDLSKYLQVCNPK